MKTATWRSPLAVLARSDPSTWTAQTLCGLRSAELEALCMLMGIPHTGTKPQRVERLLTAAELRCILADVQEPGDLTAKFKLRELQGFCIRVQVYRSTNKYGAAASLMNWRNGCRQKGKSFYARSQAVQPIQLRIHFTEEETIE